jgi:16S rRNA (uracil1498-N3)-methyltransferase
MGRIMGRHRIHVASPSQTDPDHMIVGGDAAHHASRVLRIGPGEAVVLFDGAGREWDGVVERVGREIAVRVELARHVSPVTPEVVVFSAVPKGDRAEAMVSALSQVGAAEIVPLIAARSVVTPREGKIEKWRRLAVESAKQCGRAHLLRVHDPIGFAEAIEWPVDQRVLLDGSGEACGVARPPVRDDSIGLFVGPEGGFDPIEVAALRERGAMVWSIGPHIMRIETAAVVGAAMVMNRARGGQVDPDS